ncbi:hypothetical protein GLX27_004036 [Malassezia furfur]|uniref:Pyrimidine 5-nucleotidase n=1 Tax=Malassezia furfur TaxID=55194 RepID=A0ABY8EVB7_MALFU|nr:hypothetical protein CBS14141_004193 [Malassezia furfur]WFD49356.1 hypothetical protein GLX27_004036 [Malassezia furfur]
MPGTTSGSAAWRLHVGLEPLPTYVDAHDAQAILWLDIDNTLYSQVDTRIPELMADRIRDYFRGLGLDEHEAEKLHTHYYKEYGLAIRGLVKHHTIDPMDYDEKCDGSLPLERVLHPDPALRALLERIDRRKVRVYALTNAYKTHARRVLSLLQLDSLVQGIVYCDYNIPNFSCKPEQAFYSAAQAAVHAAPDAHVYFVDDSMQNIVAARTFGWQSCVYFDELHPTDAPHTLDNGVVCVSSLQQLPRIWPGVFAP